MSATCRPATRSGRRRAKAPRTLARRASAVSSVCGRVASVRSSASAHTGTPHAWPTRRARSSAWLNPRSRSLRGCSGTGASSSGRPNGSPVVVAIPAMRSPSGAARARQPRNFKACTALARHLAIANSRPGIGERGKPTTATAAQPDARWQGTAEARDTGEGQAADPAVRWCDTVETLPANTTQRISATFAEAPLADRTERRKDEVQQRTDPDPSADPERGGRRYGRDVFQRRHAGQRSNQHGWVAPQATQRCGHSRFSGKRRARRYSSNASRICPCRSKIAPRYA